MDFLEEQGFKTQDGGHKDGGLVSLVALVLTWVLAGVIVAVPGVMTVHAATTVASPVIRYYESAPSELPKVAISSRIYLKDINGDDFATLWEQDRVNLSKLEDVSNHAVNALIATEDKRFYDTTGFDFVGTMRSAVTGSGGGSGITQQLVKNLQYFNIAATEEQKQKAVERRILRKVQELKYAIEWDKTHTKKETLLEYFNVVAFGKSSIYGIEAASQYFFKKPAKKLSLAEASALVGTVNNPVVYALSNESSAWKDRQKIVLDSMVREGYITSAEAKKAYETKLKFKKNRASGGKCIDSVDPFYCDMVVEQLLNSKRYGATPEERKEFFNRGGFTVHTNYDPKASKTVRETLKRNFGDDNPVVAPTVVVEPGTGKVIAAGVNRKYGYKKGETTISVPRNPTGIGSAFKPFVLAAALENGVRESELTFAGGCSYAPAGFDYPNRGFTNSTSCQLQGGVMDYRQATAFSSNTWYTKLAARVGIPAVKEMAVSLGLRDHESITSRSLSYALGATEEDPVSVAAAYATFANSGVYCPPTFIDSVTRSTDDKPVAPANGYDPNEDSCRRAMSPATASVVLKALRANVSGEIRGAFGTRHNVGSYPSGAKSGTNQLYNLAWAHVTKNQVVFTDVYNMDKLTKGIEYVRFRGYSTNWIKNSAANHGAEIMNKLVANRGAGKLDFNSKDTVGNRVQVSDEGYIFVPSVIGMKPAEAVKTLEDAGMTARVELELVEGDNKIPSGVIVEQSVKPGQRLSTGVEIILKESK